MTMEYYHSLLFILNTFAYCRLTQSTFYFKRSNEDSYNIQDLSKNIQESIGILPIGEIIRKAKLPQLIYSVSTEKICNSSATEVTSTEELTTKRISEDTTVKTLLRGSKDDIAKIPYEKIIKNLEYINRFNLPKYKKSIIWSIIKKGKPISTMDRKFLENLQELLYDIPESEYIHFNVKDWDVIDFFGTSKWLTRRQAAIIAYAMKHNYGDVIIQDSILINRLKGLICGFSQSDLKKIEAPTYRNIHKSVFANLWPCTNEQMIILMNTAQKPEVYGPFELWNEDVIRKIGLLLTIVKVEDFDKFHQNILNGIEHDIMNNLSDDQQQWLNERSNIKI